MSPRPYDPDWDVPLPVDVGMSACHLEMVGDPSLGRFRIARADPQSYISRDLLGHLGADFSPWMHLDGEVLTVNGTNRKVIYRIGAYEPEAHAYRMEWPD